MKILGKIGFIWFALWFIISFLLLYPFFIITLYNPKWHGTANKLRKIWAWFLISISFLRPKIKMNKGAFNQASVIVCNHTSYIDIVALGLVMPTKVSFMAKQELAKIPLFGIFFKTVDIGVNRSSIKDAHKAFTIAQEKLKSGISIVIFPEGTIWDKVPQLKPFKNGAFKLAIDAKVPIVPVTFYNNFRILPDMKTEFYPYQMKFIVHRPEITNHLKEEDSDALKNKIFAIIENELIDNHILIK